MHLGTETDPTTIFREPAGVDSEYEPMLPFPLHLRREPQGKSPFRQSDILPHQMIARNSVEKVAFVQNLGEIRIHRYTIFLLYEMLHNDR
jgi:hypothetical protein